MSPASSRATLDVRSNHQQDPITLGQAEGETAGPHAPALSPAEFYDQMQKGVYSTARID